MNSCEILLTFTYRAELPGDLSILQKRVPVSKEVDVEDEKPGYLCGETMKEEEQKKQEEEEEGKTEGDRAIEKILDGLKAREKEKDTKDVDWDRRESEYSDIDSIEEEKSKDNQNVREHSDDDDEESIEYIEWLNDSAIIRR